MSKTVLTYQLYIEMVSHNFRTIIVNILLILVIRVATISFMVAWCKSGTRTAGHGTRDLGTQEPPQNLKVRSHDLFQSLKKKPI